MIGTSNPVYASPGKPYAGASRFRNRIGTWCAIVTPFKPFSTMEFPRPAGDSSDHSSCPWVSLGEAYSRTAPSLLIIPLPAPIPRSRVLPRSGGYTVNDQKTRESTSGMGKVGMDTDSLWYSMNASIR